MDGNVGLSLTAWCAFNASGKSELMVVDGTVNQQCYIGILCLNPLSWARATSQWNFMLVQDNATPLTARNTRNFLSWEEAGVMQWTARYPDPIWGHMGLFIRYMDNSPNTVARLREVLLQALGAVTPERMEVLVRSMPGRLSGGHTRH